MPITILRLGTPRHKNEGPRIGTVRRPPRGVPKSEFAKRDFYDVWFPNLSPSDELFKTAKEITDEKSWKSFRKKFISEMSQPDSARTLDVFAALSHHSNFSMGCYCEHEERCHRSILKELLVQRGAKVAGSLQPVHTS